MVPNEERRLKREGFLNYEQVSTAPGRIACEIIHLVLEHGIKRLNNTCGVPPFGCFDSIGDSSHLSASLCLHFAHWAEAAGWEGFFELAITDAIRYRRERLPKRTYEGILWSG